MYILLHVQQIEIYVQRISAEAAHFIVHILEFFLLSMVMREPIHNLRRDLIRFLPFNYLYYRR